jgi:hypothetical protein
MTVSWNITPEEAWGAQVQQQVDAIERDIVALIESLLDTVEGWMKVEARWQDRTGGVRAALYTDIERVVRESVDLVMSHGLAIEYSVFLEYAFAGRLSILGDTWDQFFPVVYRGVVDIVRRHSS